MNQVFIVKFVFFFYLTRQVSSEQILIYNDGLPRPNPDDAGPIVRRPMGLPITAGYDAAWIRTTDCSDTSCTEKQCLRTLRHSGWRISAKKPILKDINNKKRLA